MANKAAGKLVAPRSRRRARRARRRRRADGGGHSRRQRHRARLQGRAAVCDDKRSSIHGQPLFAVAASTRDEARRAAKLAKIEIEETKPALTVDDALVDRRAGAAGLRIRPRRRRGGAGRRAASSGGQVRDRRPGAFLSRRPDLAGHSRRGRRNVRACARRRTRPRCSISSRASSAFPTLSSPSRRAAWAAASAARKARPAPGRRSPRSARSSRERLARSGSTATTISR